MKIKAYTNGEMIEVEIDLPYYYKLMIPENHDFRYVWGKLDKDDYCWNINRRNRIDFPYTVSIELLEDIQAIDAQIFKPENKSSKSEFYEAKAKAEQSMKSLNSF